MGSYVPNTEAEQLQMLKEAGFESFEDMLSVIPAEVRLGRELNIPEGKSELEVSREMKKIAAKNKVYETVFRGAGAYKHYVPAVVTTIVNKEEFVTAYTPYQAEISQGILQSIFEYQTMICELTGMDVANASVYDGATAAAEACAMCQERKRHTVYVAETVNPQTLSVIKTYGFGKDIDVKVVPACSGTTDLAALAEMMDSESACFVVQHPNYYGLFEDIEAIEKTVHEAGARLVMSVNPVTLGTLKTPAEYGADIAVGDGQPFGLGLAYGGPYLGFMATTSKMMRKIPGRIVGETVDTQGERGFVLTLQAREQHIRREKASSNICSNQALCALTASVYLAAVGPEGLKEVANQCVSKAHYLAAKLVEAGLTLKYEKTYFNEFVTECKCADTIIDACAKEGILAGLKLSDTEILWCATEMNTACEIEKVAAIVKEVC
ncbi:MAG: aminomethyl-transferring glycine dehydrogenase subunit GcvPA [Firmicutes bacterium]|nr:aminomethyl-transferring glycine dehydrogenase subunit GcvPA [Bacillota bacterium]